MKLDVEPSPDYIEHVSKVDSDINKQFPSDIHKLDDIMLDSAEAKDLQSIDVSQCCNDFKLRNLPNNTNNCKNESDCRNFRCLSSTSEINLIAPEDLFYMDKAVTDVKLPQFSVSTGASAVKDICIDEGVHAFEKVSIVYDEVSVETPEKENSEDSKPSSTTEGLRSLGQNLQSNNGDRDISTPFEEYPVEQGYCGSSMDERRQLDTTERIACTLPSEEIIELKSHNFVECKADLSQADSSSHNGSTAENQDLRQKNDQVAEEEEDSTDMISKRLFREDVAVSTSDLEVEDTSIVGDKNKVLNNQLSFQSQNDGVGSEEVMSGGDGTTSARSSFARLVHGDSDLLGPPSHLHGPITPSTHIPYSGSISFQSESSTTSARSFAFPKLQTEWSNSSPVRMAKAKRSRLRKLQGWKSKLLCCRF